MIDLTYIEIVKVKGGIPLSITQKQIIKNTGVIAFKEIEKDPIFFKILKMKLNFLKLKKMSMKYTMPSSL